jgi:hypothetical protein
MELKGFLIAGVSIKQGGLRDGNRGARGGSCFVEKRRSPENFWERSGVKKCGSHAGLNALGIGKILSSNMAWGG